MPADFLMEQMEWREALEEAAQRPTSTRWTSSSACAGEMRRMLRASYARPI